MAKRRRFMHHNRLAAAVVVANVAVFVSLMGAEGAGVDLGAVSNMVVANFALAALIRQQYVINALFWVATRAPTSWPLRIRWTLGKVYHFGGLHIGGAVSATAWFGLLAVTMTARWLRGGTSVSGALLALTYVIVALLGVMVMSSLPSRRQRRHDRFERIHRYGGWTVLALFWVHSFLFVSDHGVSSSGGSTLSTVIASPTSWVLLAVVISVALPWIRLRRVPIDITTPSSHVALVRFDYGVTPFAGSSTAVSRRPLREWHSFANVPSPSEHGFRLTISRAGDWTGALIDDRPSHLWVKGIPTAGVGNIDRLFKRVIWVATGSGIGPCLPHLLAREVPSRLVWSTRHPRRTYGDDLVDEILEVQPDAVIWDTDGLGKPDLVALAYDAYRDFDAEAVICISNKATTWQIVEEFEIRGIPAYGAIWDS